MDEIKIYYLNDTELSEFEAIQKGYRLDVYVKIRNEYYNVRIYDIVRIKQDFEEELNNDGYFAVEPNLVLVKEVNKKEIVFTIKNLCKQKYFEELKPVDNINVSELIEIQ